MKTTNSLLLDDSFRMKHYRKERKNLVMHYVLVQGVVVYWLGWKHVMIDIISLEKLDKKLLSYLFGH